MARFTLESTNRLREIEATLESIHERPAPVLGWIAPMLRELLGTDMALTFSYEP